MTFTAAIAGALLAGTLAATPAVALASPDRSVPQPERIAVIAAPRQSAASDPAVLIGQAVAQARVGQVAEARRLLRIAIASPERYDMKLADGRWMDSRQVARLALSRLSDHQPVVMR